MNVHEFVIVGAGLAGATTAYYLAANGARDIVLLEQEATPGVHSSGRNACFVREHAGEEAWDELCATGAADLRAGRLAPFQRSGSVLLGLGERDVAELVPIARGKGLWCPDDGIVDVAALLAGYLQGRDVRYQCRLQGWMPHADHLRLATTQGDLGARVLVNAAGAWAGKVGALPLTPYNRHVFVTEPMPEVDAAWPFVWDVPHGLYFRPESGGLLLSPCDETAAGPGAYREEAAALEDLAERVTRLQPGLGDLHVAHRWVGQRTFAADRAPVVGFDPREPRIFHMAGLGGHGVTASPALGALAAAMLLAGDEGRQDLAPSRMVD